MDGFLNRIQVIAVRCDLQEMVLLIAQIPDQVIVVPYLQGVLHLQLVIQDSQEVTHRLDLNHRLLRVVEDRHHQAIEEPLGEDHLRRVVEEHLVEIILLEEIYHR